MRLLKRVERSFVTQIVADTRKLIATRKLVYEKISILMFDAARHFGRAEKLRDRMEIHPPSQEKRERLMAVIALREKAGSYLWATAKFLRNHDKHSYSLARMPRLFAKPTWGYSREKVESPEKAEIPFMEFSS